jgi:hypothetical protein
MRQDARTTEDLAVARLTIRATDWQDSGVGVVVAQRPLTLLVPTHLIELVEQEQSCEIQVNGITYTNPKILATPALQRDHLSVLQFPKERQRELSSAQLPKRGIQLILGQPVTLQRLPTETNTTGTVVDVREQGDGSSVITDISVSHGDSGSPLLVSGKLAAICQGMVDHEGSGSAIAVPISDEGLAELKKLRRKYRVSVISTLIAALLTIVLALGAFAIYSSNSFTLAGIDVAEGGGFLTAQNAQSLTLKPTWTRSFDTPIRRSLALASETGGDLNRVAIGTLCHSGLNGSINLLNSNGRQLWSYSVPDGECIYSSEIEAYNGFLVDRIYSSDLDQDGQTELLVVFVHDHFFPCKLVVFSMDGEILAEFWHPGYIRTIVTGQVGESNDMLVLVSASNNALKTEFWNPQTVFAFRGMNISGQAPPYTGTTGSPSVLAPSNELWSWVIVNVDPTNIRAKCTDFNIVDIDGDGLRDIQVPLTDGRFYHLNEMGEQLGIELGDRFEESFPNVSPPPLVELWEYLETAKANAQINADLEN